LFEIKLLAVIAVAARSTERFASIFRFTLERMAVVAAIRDVEPS